MNRDLRAAETDLGSALAAFEAAQATLAAAAKARKEAARAAEDQAKRDEAAARAGQVEDAAALLESDLRRTAEGRAWAEGLYPHQWAAMRFGAGAERFILGDGMGLGKTRSAIGWLDLVGARRAIVVCLAEVAPQFAGEIEDLSDRQVILLTGKSAAQRAQLLAELDPDRPAAIVVNFELFGRKNDTLQQLVALHADAVVVDEAHTLKAPGARRNLKDLVLAQNTKADPLRPYPLDRYLATRSVKYVCLTTGTPILNGPEDIYPLLHLVDPLLFNSAASFARQYTVTNYATGRVEFKPGGLRQLQELLAGFYIARTLEDTGMQLPPKTHRIVRVDIDPEQYPGQRAVIDQLTKTAKIVLEDGQTYTVMHLMALVTRKRQANVWPAGIEVTDPNPDSPTFGEVIFSVGDEVQESAKLDAIVDEVLRQHAEGKRQVVFSQFKSALRELELRLERLGLRVARFDGDTARGQRADIKADFYLGQERKYDVLLANYKTGGTGLNLIGAQVVHLCDSEWNPGKRDQAIKRVHRIGQTEDVSIFEYRVPNSVDTWMANLVRNKERIIESFDGATRKTDTAETLRQALMAGAV